MNIGALRHRVSLKTVGAAVSDGATGYTEPVITLAARIPASVVPANAKNLERVMANTVTSSASHLVTLRFIPGVTLETQLVFHDGATDRLMSVTGKHDTDEKHVELILECKESVQ